MEPSWDAWMSLDDTGFPVEIRYGQPRNLYALEKLTAFNPWLIHKIGRLPNNLEISALVYGKWDWFYIYQINIGKIWLYYTKDQAKQKGLI